MDCVKSGNAAERTCEIRNLFNIYVKNRISAGVGANKYKATDREVRSYDPVVMKMQLSQPEFPVWCEIRGLFDLLVNASKLEKPKLEKMFPNTTENFADGKVTPFNVFANEVLKLGADLIFNGHILALCEEFELISFIPQERFEPSNRSAKDFEEYFDGCENLRFVVARNLLTAGDVLASPEFAAIVVADKGSKNFSIADGLARNGGPNSASEADRQKGLSKKLREIEAKNLSSNRKLKRKIFVQFSTNYLALTPTAAISVWRARGVNGHWSVQGRPKKKDTFISIDDLRVLFCQEIQDLKN